MNLESFMVNFGPIIACLIPILFMIIIPVSIWITADKIFPFNSKNCPVDIPKKPEKSFSLCSIEMDSFGFHGPSLVKLNFYSDFMAIESFGKFIIVSYSEEITIKDGIFFSSFSFKKDNHEYRIPSCSKKIIQYLKMKISKL